MMCLFASFLLAVALPLEQGFVSPPASARPQVWWDWMNGNVSRRGIAADLFMLAESGFGGVTIIDIGGGTPAGPVDFGSEAWLDHLEFAVAEARRFGLEVCLANGCGWSSSGGPWVTPSNSMKRVIWSSVDVSGPKTFSGKIARPADDTGFYRDIAVVARSLDSEGRCIVVSADCVKVAGWRVPEGKWRIYRFGYSSNGKRSIAASKAGRGLECDKFDAAALGAHFDAYVGAVVRRLKGKNLFSPSEGCGLTSVLIDSYEVGDQNWTHGFEREFQSRRGYSPLPHLPFLVEKEPSNEAARMFMHDMRQTCEELFVERYANAMRDKCRDHGLKLLVEPYGRDMPGLNRSFKEEYQKACDVPLSEFWAVENGAGRWARCRRVAAVARALGQRIVGAEAFTAWPREDRWSLSPFDLKASGDKAFLCGINRLYLHSFVHQPWGDSARPGMTMDKFGTHFDRFSTIWPMASEWVKYISRCQYLLQAGEMADDGGENRVHMKYADGTDGYFIAATNALAATLDVRVRESSRIPELWDPATGEISVASEWRREDGETIVSVPLDPCGSVFVMFRPRTTTGAVPGLRRSVVREVLVPGGWTLRIGGKEVQLDRLADWTQSDDADVRYFSGTARYETRFDLPDGIKGQIAAGCRIRVDLGEVKCLAQVSVNGVAYPALWRPPYEVDVTDALRKGGAVTLTVDVANLWANRLIGDDAVPGDVRRHGPYAVSIPGWVREGGAPPEGRHTFSVYRHWTKDDRPLPSGLIGPVVLKVVSEVSQ